MKEKDFCSPLQNGLIIFEAIKENKLLRSKIRFALLGEWYFYIDFKDEIDKIFDLGKELNLAKGFIIQRINEAVSDFFVPLETNTKGLYEKHYAKEIIKENFKKGINLLNMKFNTIDYKNNEISLLLMFNEKTNNIDIIKVVETLYMELKNYLENTVYKKIKG